MGAVCRRRASSAAEHAGDGDGAGDGASEDAKEGVCVAAVNIIRRVRAEDVDETERVCCVSLSLSNAIILWVSGSM